MIEMGTICCRCMRYDHCVDPNIDDFSFDKLMFTSLNDGKGISIIVSAATFDIVVVIIADFVV